ncbi:MAG TPA: carbon starvation protein A [Porphyromonadaceae bacterium]|nr:carbon starvation protein A [Porphyromonadaceae bacterium]
MISFSLCLLLLIGGYFIYGRMVEHLFKPDDRETPAFKSKDNVDYMPLPTWKVFMIQFLNIAGMGPIFGAIMGAQFGTYSFLWIVFGCIFAGAVHDYLSGMISLRKNGATLSEIIGDELGKRVKIIFNIFIIVLLLLTTAIFVSSPASILVNMFSSISFVQWMCIIFSYYIIATLLPIDKIIGSIYPVFAIALFFMVIGLLLMIFLQHHNLPEMWNGFGEKYDSAPVFPVMFISIACGAISGFHATQSPLMARCIQHERRGRFVFYGAMITEGIVALVWAAAATQFFNENGTTFTNEAGVSVPYSAAQIANFIATTWLGRIGAILAILGIVIAPITSGDTALRSCRLTVSSIFKLPQKKMWHRILITIPLSLIAISIIIWSLKGADSFKIIWRYFAWSNQTISVFTLWAITLYLAKRGKNVFFSLIPALFMTMVSVVYICISNEGFKLPYSLGIAIGFVCVIISIIVFAFWLKKYKKEQWDMQEND